MPDSLERASHLRNTLEDILNRELKPSHLEVIDESHMHSRRTETNPETHFKVVIVSPMFEGLNKVKRQQMVYSLVSRLFQTGLHALSQATFTDEEWSSGARGTDSPKCAGGPHEDSSSS